MCMCEHTMSIHVYCFFLKVSFASPESRASKKCFLNKIKHYINIKLNKIFIQKRDVARYKASRNNNNNNTKSASKKARTWKKNFLLFFIFRFKLKPVLCFVIIIFFLLLSLGQWSLRQECSYVDQNLIY